MSKPTVANIKHVVVLMFENRSFDHLLGAMPGVNGVLDAYGNIKPELYNYLDPTNPNQPGNFRQTPFPIAPGAAETAYMTNSGNDFNHNFDAMFVDLDGPGASGVVNGLPRHKPWPVYPATNTGFVYTNNRQTGSMSQQFSGLIGQLKQLSKDATGANQPPEDASQPPGNLPRQLVSLTQEFSSLNQQPAMGAAQPGGLDQQLSGTPPFYPQQYPIMSYYQWGSMQVFHRLAQEYVVCDNWFCDMPGHTAPNRAFMHCATTGGLKIEEGDHANEHWTSGTPAYMVNEESIFERLEQYGNTWKMYVPGPAGESVKEYPAAVHLDTYFLNVNLMDRLWNGNTPNQTNCSGVSLEQFCTDVQTGKLPTYSFIMSFDSFTDKTLGDPSMHAASTVPAGENLLAGVYNALRNSPHWEDTLLVVNFDENGGIYDHVRPPRAVPPHPEKSPYSIRFPNGKKIVFDFSILGFRIPALLISPWLKKGIETQQLQNTSVLRFLQDQFCQPRPAVNQVQPPPPVSYLTQRDRFANSIQVAFDDFGLTAPRPDCLDTVATYPGHTFAEGLSVAATVPAGSDDDPPVLVPPHRLSLAAEYLGPLPGHPDSNRPLPGHLTTAAALSDYAHERLTAATAYFKQRAAD